MVSFDCISNVLLLSWPTAVNSPGSLFRKGLSLILTVHYSFTLSALGERTLLFPFQWPCKQEGDELCHFLVPNADKYLFQLYRCMKDTLVSLQWVWLEKETADTVVRRSDETVEALAQRPCLIRSSSFISLFPPPLPLWVGSQGAGLNVMDLSCLLCACPLFLSIIRCVSLSGLDAVPEEFGYTCGVSVEEEGCARLKSCGENTSFPYTWQLDMLHITDLLSDTKCVCFRSVAALFFCQN